ncbi:MAG: hypothetical protein ACOYJB_05385 [Christensenellaceae bacterium]|jgi:hypothetical protein
MEKQLDEWILASAHCSIFAKNQAGAMRKYVFKTGDVMAIKTVKIPKKFSDICGQIRDGQPESTEALEAYEGLPHQKTAIYAEIAYFNGEFEKAVAYDMEICPFWGEWHYANIRQEHVAAMAFAAKVMGKENEIASFFAEQSALAEAEQDTPAHIKKAVIHYYKMMMEFIRTGISHKDETYRPAQNPETPATLAAQVQADYARRKKEINMQSADGILSLFGMCYKNGSPQDALELYEQIADGNLSTMHHIKALGIYNFLKDKDKALEVVLRMARQRLWCVASSTQVRPMEFFTHPAIHPFLKDKAVLAEIEQAACKPQQK